MYTLLEHAPGYVVASGSPGQSESRTDLPVTCAPVDSLRALPLKRLKDYLAAYNIPNIGPKEKEDFVQAVVKARNPRTGSLSQESEVCPIPYASEQYCSADRLLAVVLPPQFRPTQDCQ